MDVVKKNIESLRGKVEISSTKGKGTIFSIRLPLTLAIIEGQVIRIGNQKYIIPILSIERCLRPSESQLSTVQAKGEMAHVQGELLPVVRLYSQFGVTPDTEDPTKASLVVVEEDGKKGAFMVDELLDQQQTVIKSLGETFGDIKGVSGGAIMGDGRVSLILDVPGLLESANS
jgi:two-component system chemotaxis sensor kinase CheA